MLSANNVSKNSDKSDWYQAVMIYQSMSGDAAEGPASFTMNGGRLLNQNGDILFVNNSSAAISLRGVAIENADEEGVFLRAAAAGWGREGSNGGHVTLTAAEQLIDGDMLVDEVSSLNLYLTEGSAFTGAINPAGAAGDVYVEIAEGSVWTLTADSYISSLSCVPGGVDLNGHTLYVAGTAYAEGSVSEGEAIVVESSGSQTGMGEPPEGFGGDRPEGMGEPPQGGHGGEPPAKP